MKKFLCFMAMVCLLSACGTPKEREVTVSDVDITGLIKDYIKVVDGSYKFTNDGDNAFITVKFELIKVNVGTEICRRKHPEDIRINPIGETGEIFDTGTYGFTTSRTETSKLKDLLNTGSTGDTKSISFKWDFFGNDSSDDIAKSIFTKATTFEVIDNTFSYCSDLTVSDAHWDDLANVESVSGVIDTATEIMKDAMNEGAEIMKDAMHKGSEIMKSEMNSSPSNSSGPKEYDKMLDKLEKHIDKYKNSDDAQAYKKAYELNEKLGEVESKMSTAQKNRWSAIAMKLL